jgi:hypothetical protein
MAQFTTAASRNTAQVAAAMGTKVHINAIVNLVRDTAQSKDASKCPRWTVRAIKDGAKDDHRTGRGPSGRMPRPHRRLKPAPAPARVSG